MSLYSQNVSNNPLSLDGLITGNFDVLYVDGQPVTPTDTSGLVPYVGAISSVQLNSQKITTTYVPINNEDLTNKLYVNNTFLTKAGFNVSSGNFIFNTGSTVQLNGSTYVSCPIVASFVSILCLDATNKIVQKLTTVIGDASLGASQTFIAYNTFSMPLATNGIGNTGDISTTGLLTCANLDITGSSIATPVYALGINGSNQVVRFAGGTGDAVLSAGTLGVPQQFTGYNYFQNLLKLNGSIQFTNPVTAGTATYILGVDSSTGNLVSTTPTTAPTQLTITNTAVSNTYYPTWITSTSTGVKTIYSVNGVSYDLPTGLLTATKLKLGMPLPTGTTSSLLAVDSTGNVIAGTVGGVAYLANTQTFTGINTFNNNVIVPSGAILFAHYLYASTALLQITAQYGITANLPTGDFVVGLNSTSGLSIAGDHTLGVFAVDTLRIGYQSFPKLRFWNASTYIEWVTNSQGCDFKNATDTTFSYNQTGIFMYKPTAMNIGGWIPANGTSLYMTDTFPTTGTNNYSRYFAIGQIVYQDFFNKFMWRRDSVATGTSVVEIMSLDANGLTLQNAVNVGQPQLTFAGSGVPTIKANGNGINWSMNGGNSGYFDMNAWSAGYGWRINANQFMTMQCAYDMVIKCKVGGVSQYGANNRYIQIVTPNSVNSHQDIGGGGWYAGACVFRPEENNGNSGTGIGISMSSSPAYGGNNWGYFTAVNPGNYWLNWSFGGAVGYWCVNNTVCAYINSTSGWQAASDERCKRDIQDLNTKKSLQRVLKCKPKYYKRILREPKGDNPIPLKQEDIDRVHIGLLAQEVLEYNPHCVSTWEDDDDNGGKVERLGLAYQDFIIHLIGSVQEQQKQIDTLKDTSKKQEETINTLLDHVKRLTEQVNQITLKLK